MKLFHTADWHLCAPMECSLPAQKAEERRAELVSRFAALCGAAKAAHVSAVLIAGDLCDTGTLPGDICDYLTAKIREAGDIRFFYVPGNHDRRCFPVSASALPDNLTVFGDSWQTVSLGDGVTVTGRALPMEEVGADAFMRDFPVLPENGYSVVMLHGLLTEGTVFGGEACKIPVSAMRDRGIGYLALGHLHSFRYERIDGTCTACYSGCMEGRGFDECGEKGYVLLSPQEAGSDAKTAARFVPFAGRTLHEVRLDVSALGGSLHLWEQEAERVTADIPEDDLVKLILCGAEAPGESGDPAFLAGRLRGRFYHLRIADERKTALDPAGYENDISLRGAFLRTVTAAEPDGTERAEIIRAGLEALGM